MEQNENICSLCSASNTSKVKYFQLKDAIRPPDNSQIDGFTELHGVLKNILNINGKDRMVTNDICQKCRDKLHGIYSFTLQFTESEKIVHQITDVTVRLKKLKTFFILTDFKSDFEAIAETDKDMDSLDCSATVGHNYDVPSVAVKMECDNNFEGINFNKVMKDLNVKYSNATDGRSVEQGKIDSMENEDAEQITIEDEIIKEEWTLQEGVIFESTVEQNILDREQTKFGCDVCDEEFPTVSCLNEHTKNVHKNDLHEFNHADLEHSEEHIQRFDTKNELASDQFDAKDKSRHGLKDHLRIVHTDAVFPCDRCGGTYKTKISLNRHKQIHKGILFNCDQCDATFKRKSALNLHKQFHKGILFNCDHCDATYKSKRALNLHKQIHKGVPFNCDQCDAKFETNRRLTHHKESHAGLTFPCNKCNKRFSHKGSLTHHLRIVHSDTAFPCDHCDATYKSKSALNQHKQIHKGILFNCDQCDATFKRKSTLSQHKQIHKGILFNCDHCDATYKSKSALNLHKQIHKGIPFNCDQCEEKFKTYGSLIHHKESHAGLTFPCYKCGKTLSHKRSLRTHLRIVHSDAAFPCDHCDATYKSKSALKVHKQNLSGILFNCDQCDEKFKTHAILSRHKKSHAGLTFACNQYDGSFSNESSLA